MEEKVSVCLPVYNGAATVLQTIQSILAQTFKDFELVIVDNDSSDNSVDLVKSVSDPRIKLYQNARNLGCAGNLEECKNRSTGDILFYICSDDVADADALKKVYEAFKISQEIGIVVRPYYWFEENVLRAVRATKQFDDIRIVSINDSYDKISDCLALADQISGVGLRKKYMNFSFRPEYFVEMASMIAPMLKTCKAVILKDNIVAIRIGQSGALSHFVYERSPILGWHNLIESIYSEDKFKGLKNYLIRSFVAKNYIGLVQIKNFGSYKALLREIYYLIKFRWINIFDFHFWLFSVVSLSIPRFLLRKLVIIYKNKFLSRFLKNLSIKPGGK